MSVHEGVSCDACGKSNFRSKRFKCLICYDYDLCATCHEQGEISSDHTTEHPMQCILTRQDFDFYYHGERCTPDQPQSLTCPLCGELGFGYPYANESAPSNRNVQNPDLFQHLQMKHAHDQQSQEVICPICAAMVNGEPNLLTADLVSHIANDHQQSQVNTPSSAGEGTNAYLRQNLPTREYDFGIGGIRAGFRRGSSRATTRRGGLGRGNGPVSQHFVVDAATGLPSAGGGGSDPIADLLTQLSTVRRLAAANNNNNNNTSSLPPSSNTINLQALTRQQYERDRYRGIGRLHHHHRGSHHSQQQQPPSSASDLVSSIESDLFDSLFSSTVSIDPPNPSTNYYQTWTHIVTQQQQQQQQQQSNAEQSNSSTSKLPLSTNTTESDPSLLRRMCDESSLPQTSATLSQSSTQKNAFVQNLLLSSFAHSVNEK